MKRTLQEQLNKMMELMGINENPIDIVMHIPESIRNKDVTMTNHPVQKYGAGNIRYVKTKALWSFKEYDRSQGTERSKENIEKIKNSILKNGFTDGNELIMNYNYNSYSEKAFLTEGNHRLAAAMELGMDYLPVRVNAYRMDSPKGHSCDSPFVIDFDLCKSYGYYPSSVDASMIFGHDDLVTGYLIGIDKIGKENEDDY